MNIFNKAQKDVSSQATKTEKSVHTLDDAFRMISPSTLSAVAGVTALIGTMKSLVGVGKNIINVTSQFEQTQKALETVTQSAEKGKKLFEDLRKFSFDTTFGVDELANASQQLLNVGVSTSALKKDLKMLGDLAQGDKNKFQELTSIFSKVQSTGKASSMQLQQFALRGIPITQKLKEMGVTGTASAEQLTKAFEELTGASGQFNNAMDNIIDTIEGKKGFISDTLKEINVNFGQLTGFTDLYKKILDEVFDVLDSVNNKLMEWNSNPAHQAIVRGIVVAGITALTVAIGVGLVGAVKKLNAQLAITATLKALINPTAVALTVGISAITGLAVALESAKASANEYLDKVNEVDKLSDKYGVSDVNMAKARKNVTKGNATTKEKLAVAVDDLKASELRKKSYSMQVRDASYEDVRKNAQKDLDYEEAIYKNLQKQVKALQEQLEKEELLASKTQTREEYYQELTDNFTNFTKTLGDAYTKYSDVAKKEKELRELVEDRAKLVAKYNDKYFSLDENGNLVKLELDPEAKRKYEKDLKAINDKYKKLEIEVAVSKQEDWQKKLQEAFGFTSTEVFKGATATTTGALKYFEQMWKSQQDLYKKYGIEGSKYDSKEDYAKAIRSAFDAVLESVREGTYSGDEASLVSFANAVKDAENAVKDMTDIFTDLQSAGHSAGEMLIGYLGSSVVSASRDLSNFAQGFSQGGLIGGIISAVVGALMNVASSCEEFERAMNPLSTAFKKLKPLLEVIVGWCADVTTGLEMILDALQPLITILGWIARVLRLVGTIANMLLLPFKKLGEAIMQLPFMKRISEWNKGMDDWVATMNEAMGVEQQKTDELKKQLEVMNALYDAMKEQEEYYLKQKSLLNADTYKENTVKKVNDMILTDKGVFSTSPKDTLMAMKKPESLLGGEKTEVNVQVVDNVGVNTNVRQEGNNIFIELLSQKIAGDYADGSNGWASAIAMQQQSSGGRNISL